MKILSLIRIFNAPDAGDAGGGAGSMETGVSPVGEVTAGDMPSADTVLAELESFDAPNLNALHGSDASKPAGARSPGEPRPEEKKPEEAKPAGTKPIEKRLGGEPPARQLREELERTRRERDEFKTKLENHPRVQELEASIAERERELMALKGDVEKARKELDLRDPLASVKLREHQERFDREFVRSIELVPEIEGRYQQLVAEFTNLPRNDRAAYAGALATFESKVEGLVGSRKFGAAMEAIRKGYDFLGEHHRLRREVTENASRLAFEAREAEWKRHDGEVSGLLANALEVPEGIETSDPYHPALFLGRALEQVDEGKRKELVSTIDTFVRRVFAGQKPRSEKEFAGLSPREIQERLAVEGQWHAESRQAAVRMMKQGMLALTMLRPVVSELSRLRERVKREGESAPPGPNGGGERTGGDTDDLASYRPPQIAI